MRPLALNIWVALVVAIAGVCFSKLLCGCGGSDGITPTALVAPPPAQDGGDAESAMGIEGGTLPPTVDAGGPSNMDSGTVSDAALPFDGGVSDSGVTCPDASDCTWLSSIHKSGPAQGVECNMADPNYGKMDIGPLPSSAGSNVIDSPKSCSSMLSLQRLIDIVEPMRVSWAYAMGCRMTSSDNSSVVEFYPTFYYSYTVNYNVVPAECSVSGSPMGNY